MFRIATYHKAVPATLAPTGANPVGNATVSMGLSVNGLIEFEFSAAIFRDVQKPPYRLKDVGKRLVKAELG